ncbi:MAG: hypothetical protein WA902_05430 [Thermosynechococcaceae cyanobacterium]
MVTPTTGAVVLIPFPFSDLSDSKLRPAVVLAAAGKGDWVLCQIIGICGNNTSEPSTSIDKNHCGSLVV